MSVAVVTDSTSDLSRAFAQSKGIEIVPLSVLHRGNVYLDGVDITPERFYPMLAEGPDLPTTSQPTPQQFEEIYRPLLERADHIVSIHISSGLSATAANARSVAEQIAPERIHVFDSGFLSYAMAFQALEAARLSEEGADIKEVLHMLERMRAETELIFTLDTLHYLYKGGRIGKASSLLGTLLNIKPVIRVEDGIYVPAGRSRSVKQAIATITQSMVDRYGDRPVRVAVGQGEAAEAAEQLALRMKEALNVPRGIEMFDVGPVVGVHTGPGTLGAGVCPLF